MYRALCILFVLLSVVDLALTRWLFGRSRSQVYEVNPIAKWFLDRHGWPGMACFKSALVVLVMGLCGIIFRYRPRAARGVLTFGCASLALVICYSLNLSRWEDAHTAGEEAAARQKEDEMNQHTLLVLNRQRAAMMVLLAEIRRDLLAERCTLRQAVDRLATLEEGKISDVLRVQIRPFDDRPTAEGIAAFIIGHVVNALKQDRRSASRVGRRLTSEFERTFGRAVPNALVNMISDTVQVTRA
jgi:hypothetical protein